MIRNLLIALSSTVLFQVSAPALAAQETAQEPSTLIVYRADQDLKTKRVHFNVHVDDASEGRMQASDTLVISGQPGTYTLSTSLRDSSTLDIDLKPGSVHYVHSQIVMRGNQAHVELVEVEEQVADNHLSNATDNSI